MPENFDRYRKFQKRETNPLIDSPIIFLKGYTKSEIIGGVLSFIISIYVSAFSLLLSFLFLILTALIPRLMKSLRLSLPRNIFAHLLWFLGLWNGALCERIRRPKKTYLTL